MADTERTSWTDERLDEKMTAVDTSFDRIDGALTDLREEVRALRTDLHEDMRLLRADFARMQDRLVQIGFGLVVALIGAIAALIVALTG
jgi:hypothetical protein